MKTNSWVITRKATGEVIGEFYDKRVANRFNPATCLIETAHEYLCRINREIAAEQTGKGHSSAPTTIAAPAPTPTLYHGTSLDQWAHGRGHELYLTDDPEMAATYAINKFEEDGSLPAVQKIDASDLKQLLSTDLISLHPDLDFDPTKSWQASLRKHHSVVARGDLQRLKEKMASAAVSHLITAEARRRGVPLPALPTPSASVHPNPTQSTEAGFVAYHGSRRPDLERLEAARPVYRGSYGAGVYVARRRETAEQYGPHVYTVRVNLSRGDIFSLNEDNYIPLPESEFFSLSVGEAIPPFSFDLRDRTTGQIKRYTVARSREQINDLIDNAVRRGDEPRKRLRQLIGRIIDLDEMAEVVQAAGWRALSIDYPVRADGRVWVNDEILVFDQADVTVLRRPTSGTLGSRTMGTVLHPLTHLGLVGVQMPPNLPLRFFHGTSSEAAAQSILGEEGVRPGPTRKGKMAPVPGRVYLTSQLGYALIYALGANMVGQNLPLPKFLSENGVYGYIFVVDGSTLGDVEPDEDDVGRVLVLARSSICSSPYLECVRRSEGLASRILDLARRLYPRSYHRAVDGETAYQAWIGKRLLTKLSPSDRRSLILCGAHLSHAGPVPVVEAWRFNKLRDNPRLQADGSNFFDVAERIYPAWNSRARMEHGL